MRSWMAIFNQETWDNFLQMPSKICGFNDLPNRAFPKISVGDRIICYVSGLQVWAGVLCVSGERYRSEERIFRGGAYPNRIPVQTEISFVNLSEAVKMAELEGKLSFFPKGGTGKTWAPHVRISPRVMHDPDAEAVVSLLAERKPKTLFD